MWFFYALLAAMLWGLDYSLSEKLFEEKVSPVILMLLQMTLGVMILTTITLMGKHKTDWDVLVANRGLLAANLITFFLGNLFVFLSIQARNATLAGLIEICYPIFIVLFTWLLFNKNHLTPTVIIGGGLIFLGILVISYH